MDKPIVTVPVEIDGAAVVTALAALPDPEGSWRPEVGDVAYMGTGGSEMPVLIQAVGVIVHDYGWIERVCNVSYLSENAHGWFSNDAGQPVRVHYGTGTGSTESAGSLSPEPHDVTMARWRRDSARGRRTIGTYPPYQTHDEWREKPYTLDNLPETPERDK